MGDPKRGLYGKFWIERTDGTSTPGGKHDGCDYFVLDLTHDRFARDAIRAYAEACRRDYPLLSRDLRAKFNIPCFTCHGSTVVPKIEGESIRDFKMHEIPCPDCVEPSPAPEPPARGLLCLCGQDPCVCRGGA